VRRSSLLLLALGSLAFPGVYLYLSFAPPPETGDGFFVPDPRRLLVFAIGAIGAISAVAFLIRALLGALRRERWSGAVVGLAIVPFVPLLTSQLVDWRGNRESARGQRAVETTAEQFVAHVDAGRLNAACSLAAPTLSAHYPTFADCASLLASYAHAFPGDLLIRDVTLWKGRIVIRGDAVVVEQGRPVFELGVIYDPDTNRARATTIKTRARS
jgi:hypothetical protein